MPRVLVVANRTVAGRGVLDAVRERHEQGDHQFHLVVPIARPQHGNVIYDEAARDATRVRIELVTAYLSKLGIQATAEIGDEDPYTAATDALVTNTLTQNLKSSTPTDGSPMPRPDRSELLNNGRDPKLLSLAGYVSARVNYVPWLTPRTSARGLFLPSKDNHYG